MSNNKIISALYDFASIMLSSIIVVCVIFTFFFKISTVFGVSMENTLHEGDNVLIRSVNPELKYGDVIVISQPNGYDKVLIKRVIGVGGQTISFDRETGKVIIDGVAVDEPYIKEDMEFTYSMTRTYVIPDGMLFVMGDNRNESADSRDMYVGLIDERYVVGKVIYRVGDKELFGKELQDA